MTKIRIIIEDGTLDNISDKEINQVREDLYNFMCYRRKLLEINEYEVDK